MRKSVARRRGLVFVVSAPSGTGKSTVVDRLLRRDRALSRSISWTTRPPRAGERNLRDYVFVTEKKFTAEARRGGFAEWKRVFGQHYGTPMTEIGRIRRSGKDAVCVIDVKGGFALRKREEGTVLVFLAPPSLGELETRLRRRGPLAEADIRRRLVTARDELLSAKRYDYLVTNRDIVETVETLRCIVHAERSRIRRSD